MSLPRPASPRALLADFRAFARERKPYQWIAAGLAILMPIVIVVGFYVDGKTNLMPGEQLIYAESWDADRSDAEIVAQQKIDQARKERALAERQRQFQEVERQFGM